MRCVWDAVNTCHVWDADDFTSLDVTGEHYEANLICRHHIYFLADLKKLTCFEMLF